MVPDEVILESIRWFIGDNGYSPSVRELCAAVGIKSQGSMKQRLDRLREKGHITFVDRIPRTIRLVEDGS